MKGESKFASCELSGCKSSLFYIVQAIVIATLSGCGEGPRDRVALQPVSGRVISSGKPVEGALVVLHPNSIASASTHLYPHGETDQDGQFELATYEIGDGAPAGDWIVTLTWPDQRLDSQKRQQILASGDALPDRLRGRFATPQASRWKVVIDEQTTRLPDFDLMSR